MEQLGGWLKRDNLKGFLVALSEMIDYRFGNLDWGAFEAGMESPAEGGQWFTYPLVGRQVIEIDVSRIVEEGDINVRLSIPEGNHCLREQVRVVWMIFNRFDVSPDIEIID